MVYLSNSQNLPYLTISAGTIAPLSILGKILVITMLKLGFVNSTPPPVATYPRT